MAARKPSMSKAKAAEFLQKMAASAGSSFDPSIFERIEMTAETSSTVDARGRPEAESVMRSLHKPHAYIMKKCKRCNEPFQTNFCATSYCSDTCLAADMHDLGFTYDPYEKHRWESSMYSSTSGILYRYEPPEFIPSETLDILEFWARKFLDDLTRLREVADVRETQQKQKSLEDALSVFDEPAPAPEPAPEPEQYEDAHDETEQPNLKSLDTLLDLLNDMTPTNLEL